MFILCLIAALGTELTIACSVNFAQLQKFKKPILIRFFQNNGDIEIISTSSASYPEITTLFWSDFTKLI